MKKARERLGHGQDSARAMIGLEAEFLFLVDGEAVDPRAVLGDPRAFLGPEAMHRVGSSYHLPTGGAVYFDTGVIEVVTPVMELEPGAPSWAVRSLQEAVCAVRAGLDAWGARQGAVARLVGFSTHYNVSMPALGDARRIAGLALPLLHLIAFPVILLAANRRSTGVGVRPRAARVEVTVDFTPDPGLMAAAAAVLLAAVEEVAGWAEPGLAEAGRRGFPVLADVHAIPHTSRSGWLLQAPCFPADPFRTGPDAAVWRTAGGRTLAMRDVVRRTVALLRPRIRRLAHPQTVHLLEDVLARKRPTLLDLADRPAVYDDVGRACFGAPTPDAAGSGGSLYARAMADAVGRRPLVLEGRRWLPVATRGWTRVLYERDDGRRRTFSVEELVRLRGPE